MRFSAILTIGLLAVAVAVAGPAAAADPAHVTCVGDSITYGSGTTTPSTDSYPAQLQKLLGAGYAVQNDGRSGATMLVGGDLPYTTTTEYTAATTFAAAGGDVVIQLGTNDTKPQNWTKKAQFAADCESLVAHYQAAAGKPRVWVNLPPPVFDPSCCGIASATMRDEVVPLLKQCAAAKGASTIDVFGALSGQGAHFSDGVHPDNAGALLIAQAVQAALAKQPAVSLSATAASFTLPAPVMLKASATAAYGKIEQIEIFEDTRSVAKSASADVSVTGLGAGTHALHAVVTETGGRTAKSSPPISVVVEAGPPARGPSAAPAPAPGPAAGPGVGPSPSPSPSPDGGAPSAANGGGGGGCATGGGGSPVAWPLALLFFLGLARRRGHLRRLGLGRR